MTQIPPTLDYRKAPPREPIRWLKIAGVHYAGMLVARTGICIAFIVWTSDAEAAGYAPYVWAIDCAVLMAPAVILWLLIWGAGQRFHLAPRKHYLISAFLVAVVSTVAAVLVTSVPVVRHLLESAEWFDYLYIAFAYAAIPLVIDLALTRKEGPT